jgi:hypothetical protein
MFRFLNYIVLFILGYKIIKMVFAENKPKRNVPPSPPRQHINTDNHQQKTTSNNSKFNDAELIDYEEVK